MLAGSLCTTTPCGKLGGRGGVTKTRGCAAVCAVWAWSKTVTRIWLVRPGLNPAKGTEWVRLKSWKLRVQELAPSDTETLILELTSVVRLKSPASTALVDGVKAGLDNRVTAGDEPLVIKKTQRMRDNIFTFIIETERNLAQGPL